MAKQLTVIKGRTNQVRVLTGLDLTNETISSEIRSQKSPSSTLIATWQVAFETDGADGVVILTLDDSVSKEIQHKTGYMDLKRVSAGEPLSVFKEPLLVVFDWGVTS